MDKLIKMQNLQMALKKLAAFIANPIADERDEAGIIQAFEFTIELAWKTLQALAEAEMFQVASPKAALTFALRAGFINIADEAKWVQMLKDRNMTSHTYNADLARDICKRVCQQHFTLINDLVARIEKVMVNQI